MQMADICVCLTYAYVLTMPVSFFFCGDPKITSPGSADRHSPPAGQETQDVPHHQLRLLPYVVFRPYFLTRRAAADIAALLIPSPW